MIAAPALGLFGAGGCGRGIMPLVRKKFPGHLAAFVEDRPKMTRCNGHDLRLQTSGRGRTVVTWIARLVLRPIRAL